MDILFIGLFLISLIGIIMNIIVLVVCLRQKLRNTPFFLFIVFQTVFDSLNLCGTTAIDFFQGILNIDLLSVPHFCGFFIFLDIFTSQYGSWILVNKCELNNLLFPSNLFLMNR